MARTQLGKTRREAFAAFAPDEEPQVAIAERLQVSRQRISVLHAEWLKTVDGGGDKNVDGVDGTIDADHETSMPSHAKGPASYERPPVALDPNAVPGVNPDLTRRPTHQGPMAKTLAKREAVLASLRNGAYRNVACRLAGWSKQGFNEALKDETTLSPEGLTFREQVEQAESEDIEIVTSVVRDEIVSGRRGQRWQPAIQYLERRHGDLYAKQTNISARIEGDIDVGLDIHAVLADPDMIGTVSQLEGSWQMGTRPLGQMPPGLALMDGRFVRQLPPPSVSSEERPPGVEVDLSAPPLFVRSLSDNPVKGDDDDE
jgi:hypothetical protein